MEQKHEEILLSTLRQNNSCERTGERKRSPSPSGRKPCLQVAGAPVQFLSSLPCCERWTEVTHCTCQRRSHTPRCGRKQHTPVTPWAHWLPS